MIDRTGPGSDVLQPFQPKMHQPDRPKTIDVVRLFRPRKNPCNAIARHRGTQTAKTIAIVADPYAVKMGPKLAVRANIAA